MTSDTPKVVAVAQDEIITGEAVALDVQPVGFLLRALGAIIDYLALTLVAVAIYYWITVFVAPSQDTGPIFGVLFLVTFTVVVPTVVETLTRGRSLGRLAVGGRIVRLDGGAAGFRQAFIRALVGVLEVWFTFGMLAAMVGIFSSRGQRIGDLLAGTYCERTRAPKLPPTVPQMPPALESWAAIADVGRLPDRLARRVAHYVQFGGAMDPHARARIATSLVSDVAEYVSPLPEVPADILLRGIAVIRHERELRALRVESDRSSRLLAGGTGAPRGFPER